jgi:DNA-binding Lrp family transcriptional regulator
VTETLWDIPPHNGTPTSIDAAEAIHDASTLRATVLAAIEAAPNGLTREELEKATGLSGNTVRPRVWELLRAGRITACGCRPTASGRAAAVLVAKGVSE